MESNPGHFLLKNVPRMIRKLEERMWKRPAPPFSPLLSQLPWVDMNLMTRAPPCRPLCLRLLFCHGPSRGFASVRQEKLILRSSVLLLCGKTFSQSVFLSSWLSESVHLFNIQAFCFSGLHPPPPFSSHRWWFRGWEQKPTPTLCCFLLVIIFLFLWNSICEIWQRQSSIVLTHNPPPPPPPPSYVVGFLQMTQWWRNPPLFKHATLRESTAGCSNL